MWSISILSSFFPLFLLMLVLTPNKLISKSKIGHAQDLHLETTTLEPGSELFIRFPTKSATKFSLISGEKNKNNLMS